jgi:hypothetical protein
MDKAINIKGFRRNFTKMVTDFCTTIEAEIKNATGLGVSVSMGTHGDMYVSCPDGKYEELRTALEDVVGAKDATFQRLERRFVIDLVEEAMS